MGNWRPASTSFCKILAFCEVSELSNVWEANYEVLVEDILPKKRKQFNAPNLECFLE